MTSQRRVLVLEDHADSRNALTRMLRGKGFHVTAYDNCHSAECHLADCDVDIALLDVRLPGRCGDDFGRELRQRCHKTMIVFVTGEAIIEPLKKVVPDCFVMRKPIDADLLLELLECFDSKTGYGSTLGEQMDDRAGPGNI
jgi:DNA-binding response OmpR family regulator